MNCGLNGRLSGISDMISYFATTGRGAGQFVEMEVRSLTDATKVKEVF